MKEITVIIPSWNGKKYLLSCLEALYKHTELEMDVIVVDNGSTDGSVEAASVSYPAVNYILLQQNYGFSKAVNEGIKRAKTPYVLLLNNDTRIEKGFAEALLKRIKSDPMIFSVEAKMLQYHNPKMIDSAGTFYNVLGWAYARGKGCLDKKYNEACETFAACAGAAIYRKSIFDEIGLFDERFFAYLEDIDIGYRARKHGYRNMYEPKARVLHVGSASSGSRHNRFKVEYSARNNIYLIRKNMSCGQIVLRFPFLLLGFGIKFLYFTMKGFGKEYLSGIKKGFALCRNKQKVSWMKRAMDLCGAWAALALFSPIMILTALAIKVTTKGPVIFKQNRVGLDGKEFCMYKFRSMIVQDEEEEKKAWTKAGDPRITPIGQFLRKTNIDELPQLINVIKGEMSLVGPRPERPQFVDKFKDEIPGYMVKHQVRPGMTGWAQMNGYRGDTSLQKRIEYDLYYIENGTLGFDIKILVMTLFKGFKA